MRLLVILLLSGIAYPTLAQAAELPHTFAAGTPARAAEVNANFDALVTAIDETQAAVQGLQQAGTQQIGTLSITGAPYNGTAIPIYLIQWDNTFDLPGGGGGGGGAGAPTFGGITIGKQPDGFTPQMFLDFASGKAFAEATIQLTAPGPAVTTYHLNGMVIIGFGSVTATAGRVLDSLTLAPMAELTVSTTAAGSPAPSTCFDIPGNAAC